MNAITLLERDHRTVEKIFDQLENLEGDGSSRKKKDLCEQLVRELSVHTAIEEMIFYPEVKRSIPEAKELVLESLEEHNVVKWELDSIQSLKVGDARLDAKIKVLKDAVLRHIEEEENVLFPMVREQIEASKLSDMGKRLGQIKSIAPTRPHPRAPSQPPANVVIGMGASVVDRTMDAVRTVVRGHDGERAAKKGHRTTKKRAPTHAKRARARGGRAAHAH